MLSEMDGLTYALLYVLIVKGVANVHEHGLSGSGVCNLGLETTVLLRVFLPASRVAVVGLSTHCFQRLAFVVSAYVFFSVLVNMYHCNDRIAIVVSVGTPALPVCGVGAVRSTVP